MTTQRTSETVRRVTLIELESEDGLPEARLDAVVVKVTGKTAFVRHDPGFSKPWTMPVDRKTGRPPKGERWAWRVVTEDLPL